MNPKLMSIDKPDFSLTPDQQAAWRLLSGGGPLPASRGQMLQEGLALWNNRKNQLAGDMYAVLALFEAAQSLGIAGSAANDAEF